MRKFFLPVVLCLGLIGGWQVFEAVQAGAQGTNVENFGFGQRIAGTWYYENFVNNEVPNEAKVLQTLSADGTFSHTDTDDFASFFGGFESPAHGSWRRTGPREMEGIFLYFVYEEDGALNFTVKVFFELRFSEDFNSSEASFVSVGILPGQDPLGGGGIPGEQGTFTGRRLQFD